MLNQQEAQPGGGNGNQGDMFGGHAAPGKARGNERPQTLHGGVLDGILDELDQIRKFDDKDRQEAMKFVGGKFLDVSESGMSTVGKWNHYISYRSTAGSIAKTGLEALSFYHAVKSEGPAILRLFGKIGSILK